MAGVVVADAGPLIALARLDALSLLAGLFGSVVAPAAVYDECLAKIADDSLRITGAVEAGWLRIVPSAAALPEAPRCLGEGEKQAIALALAHPSALLILDDRLARRHAEKYGLAFIGTARLLFIAEQRGMIDSADGHVEALRSFGYRISLDIVRRIRHETR